MKIKDTKNKMNKIGVYQIKNLVNNKIYIGSTTQSFIKRLSVHLNHLYKGTHHSIILQRAWDKYGEENFEFSILELCKNNSIVLEREQYWLDKLKPYNRNIGYNILTKSNNSQGYRHTEETLILIGQLSKSRDNSKAVESMRLKNLGSKKDEAHSTRMSKLHSKSVIQLSLNGIFIQEWDSGTLACKNLGLKNQTNISKCCKGKCKSYGGFMWVYKEDYNPNKLYKYSPIINGIR